jgi:hypothetical protein
MEQDSFPQKRSTPTGVDAVKPIRPQQLSSPINLICSFYFKSHSPEATKAFVLGLCAPVIISMDASRKRRKADSSSSLPSAVKILATTESSVEINGFATPQLVVNEKKRGRADQTKKEELNTLYKTTSVEALRWALRVDPVFMSCSFSP